MLHERNLLSSNNKFSMVENEIFIVYKLINFLKNWTKRNFIMSLNFFGIFLSSTEKGIVKFHVSKIIFCLSFLAYFSSFKNRKSRKSGGRQCASRMLACNQCVGHSYSFILVWENKKIDVAISSSPWFLQMIKQWKSHGAKIKYIERLFPMNWVILWLIFMWRM